MVKAALTEHRKIHLVYAFNRSLNITRHGLYSYMYAGRNKFLHYIKYGKKISHCFVCKIKLRMFVNVKLNGLIVCL